MIQFNLLPDVKLEFIKIKRTKHLVLVTAFIISGVSLAILAVMFSTVSVLQEGHLDNLSAEIAEDIKTLKEFPELEKILTIQNQLNSINALHAKKPNLSRLVYYLSIITPETVTISSADLVIETPTLNISGNAPDLATINKLVDTLKFAKYTVDGETMTSHPFSKVVLTNFTASIAGLPASYTIDLVYDPVLFDRNKIVKIIVPSQITTRSETEKPKLFQPNPANKEPGEGQ